MKVKHRRIREIVFTDRNTLDVFKYTLDKNGCHFTKMDRAKRTHYNLIKKKVNQASDVTPTEGISPIFDQFQTSDEINLTVFLDIDLIDPLPLRSITDPSFIDFLPPDDNRKI